jgi:EAL domain-containing protein (putative c-di-GMP-specific phosphodiesterase class I)
MDVVAEGIETTEQYELMKRFGCDQGQGYLMSKPVNLNDFEWLLNKSLSREF